VYVSENVATLGDKELRDANRNTSNGKKDPGCTAAVLYIFNGLGGALIAMPQDIIFFLFFFFFFFFFQKKFSEMHNNFRKDV